MEGRESIDSFIKEIDGGMMIIGVDIHQMSGRPWCEQRHKQDVPMIDHVSSHGWT